MNMSQIISQKLVFFQHFLQNLNLKLQFMSCPYLSSENCQELGNLKVENFYFFNMNEIQHSYLNFLKEK